MLRSVLELDSRLSDRIRLAEQPGGLRSMAVVLAHSGDSWFWGAGLFLLSLAGNSFWKDWAIVQAAAIGILAVVVLVIKFLVRRQRPAGDWGSIYRNTDPHSFPSGHAARAFLIAVIAAGLGPLWLAIALWIWAPLVAVARVVMGVHYVSDVVAGGLLGLCMGVFALRSAGWILDLIHPILGLIIN